MTGGSPDSRDAKLVAGGVFVLFLGPASSVAPAAAWFTTANGLMQLDGSALFSKTLVVAPPGFERSDYKGRFADHRKRLRGKQKDIPLNCAKR